MSKTADQWKAEGNAFLQAQQFDEAIEAYTQAIEIDPTNHVYYSNRSAAYLSMGQASEALTDAERVMALNPDWPKGYSRKGASLHALKRYDDAMAAYNQGLAKFPEDPGLNSGLEDVRRERDAHRRMHPPNPSNEGTPEGSLFTPQSLQKLASHPTLGPKLQDPVFAQKLSAIATDPQQLQFYMNDTDVMEALSVLMGIPLSGGSSAGYQNSMTPEELEEERRMMDAMRRKQEEEEREEKKRREEAAKQREEAEKKRREEERVNNMSEEEKEQYGRDQEAAELRQQGNAFYKKKDFEEALRLYDEGLALSPFNLKIVNNKLAVLMERKEFEVANTLCEQMVAVMNEGLEKREVDEEGAEFVSRRFLHMEFEDQAKFYVRQAKILRALAKQAADEEQAQQQQQQQGQEEEERDESKEGQEDSTPRSDLLRQASYAALQNSLMNKQDRAVERMMKNWELEDKKEKAQRYINPTLALEHKERGNAFFRDGDFVKATEEYEEAIRRDPSSPVYHHNLSSALLKIGDFTAALRHSERAIDLDPSYWKAWAKKGDIEFFQKEFHKAMASYNKGLSIEPNNQLCRQGMERVVAKMNMGGGGGSQGSDGSLQSEDELRERQARAMADPEIQQILSDPVMMNLLQGSSQDGGVGLQQAMASDPLVAEKVNKLYMAGILSVGGK